MFFESKDIFTESDIIIPMRDIREYKPIFGAVLSSVHLRGIDKLRWQDFENFDLFPLRW